MTAEEAEAKRNYMVNEYCELMDSQTIAVRVLRGLDQRVLRAKYEAEAAQNVLDCIEVSDKEREVRNG